MGDNGVFAAPTWDGKNPVIPLSGWDEAQAWQKFDQYVIANPAIFERRGLACRFSRLKNTFAARRAFYKRIGVTVIFGKYDFR